MGLAEEWRPAGHDRECEWNADEPQLSHEKIYSDVLERREMSSVPRAIVRRRPLAEAKKKNREVQVAIVMP